MKAKNYSDEMLKEYISSEISLIKEKSNNKKNWRKNEDFHSQITIRVEEGECNVPTISNDEL